MIILWILLGVVIGLFGATAPPNFDWDGCPECGAPLKSGPGGGEECTKCNYWWCY